MNDVGECPPAPEKRPVAIRAKRKLQPRRLIFDDHAINDVQVEI
jgi:hypothetical protein